MTRRLAPGAGRRRVDLAARVPRLPSAMERGNAYRAELYASPRWRRERRAFLQLHPICVNAGKAERCTIRATVPDHRGGHQRPDWLDRFWDQSTWQPMCSTCHAAKSRAELQAWREAGEGEGGVKVGSPGANKRREPSRESGPKSAALIRRPRL